MLFEAIASRAHDHPTQEAVVSGPERLTYAELTERAQGLAAQLLEGGLLPGDVVPLLLENGADFVVGFLAVAATGAHPLPLPPGLTQAELATLLASHPVSVALGAATVGERTFPRLVSPPFRVAGAPTGDVPTGELLLATSGSTGLPKIVRLGLEGVVWNARAHAASIGLCERDRLLVVSPLYHAASLVAQLLAALLVGGTVVLMRGAFSPRGLVKAIAREGVTVAALTPSHVRLMLDRDPLHLDPEADVRSLRAATVGAAPAQPEDLLRFAASFLDRAQVELFVTYGLTEAGPRVTTLPAGRLGDKGHTVGRPLDGVAVRVVAPGTDVELGTGEVGELQVQSPSCTRGFLGETPRTPGWLATGDLAELDPEGFVELHGRLKDIILSGGSTLSPLEIERALRQDPHVREVAVVGEPHPVLGEIAVAYVVPAGETDAEALIQALEGRLSPHKLPRRLTLVQTLPYTPTGKTDKQRLRVAGAAFAAANPL